MVGRRKKKEEREGYLKEYDNLWIEGDLEDLNRRFPCFSTL